jgi:hypothetical protein
VNMVEVIQKYLSLRPNHAVINDKAPWWLAI